MADEGSPGRHSTVERHLGFWGATAPGVGAIVGGGILALAGPAFALAGPSAVLALALNGVIAILTALSFAEVSSKFPQSGGTYAFAKKVLSIEAAFTVGWVVWFASIAASVLYALGCAEFGKLVVAGIWRVGTGSPAGWLTGPRASWGLALLITAFYTIGLMCRPAGGGQWANIGKLVAFAILIAFGPGAVRGRSGGEIVAGLQPFFAGGAGGFFTAMGLTFFALQGFDLIAAVAGEVRDPVRTIPRAMFCSLGIGLGVYLPFLVVTAVAAVQPGQSLAEMGAAHAETFVAVAAQNYLGPSGYWLVIVAGFLSMASALHANLFAASRVAMAMAADRTLPPVLAWVNPRSRTPLAAVLVTAVPVVAILLVIPDVTAAGAASSLIFLLTFAVAHWIAILVRQRSGARVPPFRSPWYPAVPVVGGVACLALAVNQGLASPAAGVITLVWLCLGGLLFLVLFAQRARVADASGTALDPELIKLRGRNPLVLVPIANPENVRALADVAKALAPPEAGRVLMLSVVVAPRAWQPRRDPQPLDAAQAALREALAANVESGIVPETLATVAEQPWAEIARVAGEHRCESLLLGLSRLTEETSGWPLETLLNRTDCDVVVLRAAAGWQLSQVRRVLVPLGGRGGHDKLLARLLGSLARSVQPEVTFLKVLPAGLARKERQLDEQAFRRTAQLLCPGGCRVELVCDPDPISVVAARAADSDLVIMGVQRAGRRRKLFGQFALQVALRTAQPLLLVSRRG